MEFRSNKTRETQKKLRAHLREIDASFKSTREVPPLRSELFNVEQMEQHGKILAEKHLSGLSMDSVQNGIKDEQLLTRLNENEELLIDAHSLILESTKANRQITPAGEWLLDNFYLIEDHIRTAKRHLPKQYSEELPRLTNGTSSGLPRVYDIAKEIISHGDGRVKSDSLSRFIKAYQTITLLKIGELWAIPIMLRFALIENLRRVAFRVALGRIDRNLADFWADQMMDILEKDPKSLILVAADMARSNPPMSPPFVSEFTRRLQGQSSALGLPITWIEQHLAQTNQTIAQMVHIGNQQLAVDQVSISNSIASLRFLGAMNWKEFVEELSIVDQVLSKDPAGAYLNMDFTSRDHYRHIIENIAKNSDLSEEEVALEALKLAEDARQQIGAKIRSTHVGYYLIDKGLSELEAKAVISRNFPAWLKMMFFSRPLLFYILSILLFTAAISWGFIKIIHRSDMFEWMPWFIDFALILSVSYFTIAMVNWLVTLFAPPRPLPRLDLTKGIPPESRTIVVVPCMLTTPESIEVLAEELEVRYLANQDVNLHFGLLTDNVDSDYETLPEDEFLLKSVSNKIEELNDRYKIAGGTVFYLFHRPRKWNPSEKLWMGRERKRGKLSDLNALIKGKGNDRFSLIIGNTDILSHVKYVITLDVDTQLPRDSAGLLIGTLSHPLNKPFIDVKRQIVTEGYTILQPRIAVSLPGTNKSRYAKLFGSEPGIDPYTRTISDVYQDLFSEGSFIGKGIYDVDSFERIFGERFPENRILSHDLLEGCYSRSGLLSDILLFEEYPATYFADVSRRYRWVRGDWQLFRWLMPKVPDANKLSGKNPLSGLSIWKLFDNLRRSLIPVAMIALLIAGWTILSLSWIWTVAFVGIVFIPSVVITIIDAFNKPEYIPLRQHLIGSRQILFRYFIQYTYMIICLPFEAFYNLDAIARTVWRLLISKRKLLEWNTDSKSGRFRYSGISGLFRKMWICPLLSITLTFYLAFYHPASIMFAWPFLVLWFLSPVIIWWFDRPIPAYTAKLSDTQYQFLFELARKTWSFFETFVTSADNWLPPDNYQEHPNPVIAHRTSPTNMGLSLLANLTAYDFGYITGRELVERTYNALNTMNEMEKYQGHFYNWYDTRTLAPLLPLYVSSVDSGNLAGHLITLKSGLVEFPDRNILGPRFPDGIRDTYSILKEIWSPRSPGSLLQFGDNLDAVTQNPPNTLSEVWQYLKILADTSVLISIQAGINEQVMDWSKALTRQCQQAKEELEYLAPWLVYPTEKAPNFEGIPTLRQLSNLGGEYGKHASERIDIIDSIIAYINELTNMEYEFLYDGSRHLQSVGYNVDDRRRDASFYDLLASEARLSSFVAIAQGQIPQESWFALGRKLTGTDGETILLSWSGSMFEYLMPLIVMPVYENTLLYQACNGAILKQIDYGKQHDVPWGISESGYNSFDLNLNYQYHAFGVPGLGLKRGLSDDLVIAPYASALALLLRPEESCRNLERMQEEGFLGRYGFYEAIDYTPTRLPRGQSNVIVRSFMSHHVGMSLLALSGFLLNRPMQRRFESDASLHASLLLLHERVPRYTSFQSYIDNEINVRTNIPTQDMPVRIYDTPSTPGPMIHLLSNGRYQVMISNAGGGYSRWKELAVTRWREDSTCDHWGNFCYIRDAESGYFWSTAYQPTLKRPERYEAIFSEGRAEFRRRDQEIDTHTEIVVSPEDDIELRRVHLKNRTRTKRIIDITSYMEVVLALPQGEATHPAFNNLFIQTEIVYQRQAVLCTRRPRSDDEKVPWMFHLMAAHGAEIVNITYETDRLKFLGRGNTAQAPLALTDYKSLSNSEGPVLDPIVAIQYQIILEPEALATIDMVTGVSESREEAMLLIEKYQDKQLANRVFDIAWTHSQVVLQQINAVESDAQLYGRMAGSIVYAGPLMRPESSLILRNRRGQNSLWGHSISGDLPIVLVQIEDPDNINLIRQLLQAHAYWHLKGLIVDLVIWIEDYAGYRQSLYDQIIGLIAAGIEANIMGRPGGIYIRSGDQLSADDRLLFQAVSRVVISDRNGTLADQLNRRIPAEPVVPNLKPLYNHEPEAFKKTDNPNKDLVFFNGSGGFTPDGREYIIYTSKENVTPVPWSNVIANDQFGTVLSENGQAYTWCENAHEFRLSPWNNDPVTDTGGEAIYIRDEETGHVWSPTALIKSDAGVFKSRHGFGYSIFEHTESGIITELCVYVALDASIKFSVLKIRNDSGRTRKISVTAYVEWVLGDLRSKTAMHITTEVDPSNNILYAHNPYSLEFSDRVGFLQVNEFSTCSFTCDRREFLGRNGTMSNPAAMKRTRLSNRRGAALDPCAAIQITINLADKEEDEIIFTLGSGRNMEDATLLAKSYTSSFAARSALEDVWRYWKQTLGMVQVQTPDSSLNFLVNGWLIYQTLASRMWARSGYYQSGGAIGFRDQLQDAMTLVHTAPHLLRRQILQHAGQQFIEGDVQHWWHPPSGRGVRTMCSDDYLWLPLATYRYVKCTGDHGVLDESIFYLEGRSLNPDEDSYFDLPNRSNQKGTLYQHCVLAIEHGLRYGEHGLPLMGSHDWNDGMNKVGNKGKGESVWLGFFLYEILIRFSEIASLYGDTTFADRCKQEAAKLRENLELHGWDGEWYLRAYFDDGTPLGSVKNQECSIDSLSQSWAVLSGAGNPERTRKAMESVNSKLVNRENALVQLLDPPFDKSELNPGYIKGYIPGVRENGGQYTHAAIWTAMAFAKMGDRKKAWEVLSLINPINHALTPEQVMTYKVEPYVISADVYSRSPHTGRGGWTWYTGSAGWMYRLILESLLGIRIETDKLFIQPILPDSWESLSIQYCYRQTIYRIMVMQTKDDSKEPGIVLDGNVIKSSFIPLVDDAIEHTVIIALPPLSS